MIIETLRMVAAVLSDNALGVNAQLLALPLDGGDVRPIPVASIKNAVDHDITIQEGEEPTFPIVVIDIAEPITAPTQIMSGVRSCTVPLLIAYLKQNSSESQNNRDADYTLRAIVKSLSAGLFASGKRDTAGRRNSYVISKASDLRYGPTQQPMYGALMVGAVQSTLTVRDLAP
jgi:hypothetical protein